MSYRKDFRYWYLLVILVSSSLCTNLLSEVETDLSETLQEPEVQKPINSDTTDSHTADKKKLFVINQEDRGDQIDPETLKKYQEEYDLCIKLSASAIDISMKQMNVIHMMLSILSNIVENEKINVQPGTIEFIKQMSRYVQQFQTQKFLEPTIQTATILIGLNYHIMQNILKCLKGKPFLSSMAEIISKLPINRNSKSISPSDLKKRIIRNKKIFMRFKTEVNEIGLSKTNKVFRNIDAKFGRFVREHDIIGRTATIAIPMAIASGFVYHYSKAFISINRQNKTAHEIRELVENVKSETKRATKSFDAIFFNPLCSLALGYAGTRLYEEYNKHFCSWFSAKCDYVANMLRGGAYVKEALKIADIGNTITFDDVIGMEEAKETLEYILQYLDDPEGIDRIGATPPKGILISGATRAGKSFLAQALGGEYGRRCRMRGRKVDEFKFLPITYSDFKQYGIHHVLNLVKKCAPCIVFIDEIDLLDLQRKGQNERLCELLTAMSGTLDQVNSKHQVIIIAATNRPQHLDNALLQPGRFGKRILLDYPRHEHRKEFFRRKLDKLSLDTSFFDLDNLANRTDGASYGALELALSTALLKARVHNQGITQEHLEAAIDECVHHIAEAHEQEIADHEKEILAAHFAGHALALSLLDSYTKVAMVSIQAIIPPIKEKIMGMHLYQDQEMEESKVSFGAIATYKEYETVNVQTKEEKLKTISYLVSGFVAEELLLGSCGYSCHQDDMEKALTIAQSLTCEGLDQNSRLIPDDIKTKRFLASQQLIEQCKDSVKELFKTNLPKLRLICEELQEKGILNSAELSTIISS